MATTVERPRSAPAALIPPSDLHARALEAAGRGETDEAIALLTQTLHAEPRRASALSDLAVLVHGLGRPDEALRLLDAACAADPAHVDAWENLLDLLTEAGEALQVRRVIRAWRRARPDEPAALARARSLGLAVSPTRDVTRALEREDVPAARRAWMRAVAEDPADPHLLELAIALLARETDPTPDDPDDTEDPAVVVVRAPDLAGIDAQVRVGPGALSTSLPFVAIVSSEDPVGALESERLDEFARVFDAGDARLIATSEIGARRARRAGLDVRDTVDDAASVLAIRRELAGRRPVARPMPSRSAQPDPTEMTVDLPFPAAAEDLERRAAIVALIARTTNGNDAPRFLDADVGDGRVSAELARHGHTVAASASSARLELVRRRSGDRVETHAIDLFDTHHAYSRLGRFDAVVARERVTTLPRADRHAALRRLARLLVETGVVILEIPHRRIGHAGEHPAPRTRDEIERDAAAFGFEVVASLALGRTEADELRARVVAFRPTHELRTELATPEAPMLTPRAGAETRGAPPLPHLRPLAPRETNATPAVDAPLLPIHWVGDVLAPGGYATYNRHSILWLRRAGLRVGCRNHGVPNEGFLASLTPDDLFELRAALSERVVDGVLAVNYQPALPTGHDIYRQMRWQHPEHRAYVGLTTFETESMPPHWVGPANAMDAIWVPSSFSIGAFEKAGVDAEKIEAIGFAIDASLYDSDRVEPVTVAGRRDASSFLFYSVFQWHGRKGWRSLIEAWARAFTRDDDVELLVKTMRGVPGVASPGEQIDDHLRSLGFDRSRVAPIHVIDAAVSDTELRGLYAAADAFVLPSRGEGWGIPYLEAMASGLPTIGTRWSGQLDFMNDDNAYLIELNRTAANPDGLVPVDDEMLAFNREYAGQRYADPSVEHLVELMRQVRDRPDEARARGRRAADDVRRLWSPARYVERVVDATRRLTARVGDRRVRPTAARRPASVTVHASVFEATGASHDARTITEALVESDVPVELAAHHVGVRVESTGATMTARLVDRLLSPAINLDHGAAETAQPIDPGRVNVLRARLAGDRLGFSEWARLAERDEVWVASAAQIDALVRDGVARERIRRVPLAVDIDRFRPDVEPMPIEGAPGFRFLACFDHRRRKGWDALLKAFFREFEPEDDVTLILNVAAPVGRLPRDVRAEILGVARRHARRRWVGAPLPLVLLPGTVEPADLPGLYRAADAYAHPSRACAGGLPVLEAMASGVPVVAIGWGAHTDFTTEDTALLVDFTLVPVTADACAEEPRLAGRLWAEPDPSDLRAQLRRMKDDAPLRAGLAARALEHVRAHHAPNLVGATVVAEVGRIGRASLAHPSSRSVRAVWRGPAREVGSLAIVNDALTDRLEASYGVAVERRTDPRTFDDPVDADVVVSHGWPPALTRPNGSARHVVILPWEYGRLPSAWIDAMRDGVDELWVPSRHVFAGVVASGFPAGRVRVVPNGVDPYVFQPRGPRIELPTTKGFRFLFVGGTIWRKGADVLLAAYDAAFGPDDDVTLIVKEFGENGVYRTCSGTDQLRERAKDARRAEVVVIDETLSIAEMAALYRSCDVLVHPYRGEGFAMPVAEASACGTPAIATAGGATSDFHFDETGWPLRATPTPFTPEAPYQADGWILEPDAVELANLMLEVRRCSAERRARGAKASTYVRSTLGWNTIAEAVAARLRALR